MSGGVLIRREGDVLCVVLANRERRNALTRDGLAAVAGAVADPPDGVRAVVLSGADGTFSAGADFRELDGTVADVTFDETVAGAVAAIDASPLVVLAAIDGACVGAAVDLALSCDVRIASAGAFFEVPAVRLGLLYNPPAIARMHATLPRLPLARMLLLGDRFDAAAARAAGLIDDVVDGDAAAFAIVLADRLAAATPAARATKRLLRELDAGAYDLPSWEAVRRGLLASPERREALDAARARHLAGTTGERER